jgi:hypothetical protein
MTELSIENKKNNNIALYSRNFGNYRNEFKNYYDKKLDTNFDYYLYTDKELNDEEIKKLKDWNIIKTKLIDEDTNIMDKNRWTSKHVKFILPKELEKYDYVIYIDSKVLIRNIYKFINYSYITKIINKYPENHIFNLKNPYRKTIQEELLETKKRKLENKISADNLLELLKDYKSNFYLPDLCFFIRKKSSLVDIAFLKCYEALKTYRIKRDQNIYNYIMDQDNIKPILYDFYSLKEIN